MTSDELFQIFMQGLLTSSAGEVERCFRSWADAVDMGDVDPRAVRLMPAFQAALLRHGLPVPFPGHLKKFERYWWLNQKWLERSTKPAVEKLLEAGIPVVALKGLSVRNVMAQPTIRTMSDIDLWVPGSFLPRCFYGKQSPSLTYGRYFGNLAHLNSFIFEVVLCWVIHCFMDFDLSVILHSSKKG